MKRLKVTVKNLQKKFPITPTRIKGLVLKALSSEGIHKSGEINIFFVSDAKIKKLNLKYLGKDSPTDVLAFDIGREENVFLADIIISTDTAFSNAKIFNSTPVSELYLYVIHGTLHILGYDDKTAAQRKIMEGKAARILSKIRK